MSHLRLYAAYHCRNEDRRIKCLQHYIRESGEKCEVQFEYCYNILLKEGTDKATFLKEHWEKIRNLLNFDLFEEQLQLQSILKGNVLEVGPRLSIKTAYCTNVLSILDSVGIDDVDRVERSRRYSIGNNNISHETFLNLVGDRMTECIYATDSIWSTVGNERQDFTIIDLLSDENNLRKANIEMGLAFDEDDILYYMDLYKNKLKRNPTDVELFDLAQSDSEHSRHWFFNGILTLDKKPLPISLMKMVKATLSTSNPNSVIAFCDNSSAIQGFGPLMSLYPEDPTRASSFNLKPANRHIIYSAETHNFPTAVCPFQGATTGTGGRIRDIHSTGKGAYEIAGIAGYSVGNLHLDGYKLPWECTEDWKYPPGFSCPDQIIIDASNGVSDYGNKFGEPVICGFTRTFGLRLPDNQRFEYAKPILFSGGVGSIDEENVKKIPRKKDNVLTKIGGPVYRIGVGGGAASSLAVQGSRESHLDFGAVQRGDPEMGQKLHRVVRSCAEHVDKNPILAIHDQGAGGNGNVLRELVENQGAVIKCNAFELGDPTLSVKELWTAEYQESDAALVDRALLHRITQIAKREKCKVSFVGEVNDSMKLIVEDFTEKFSIHPVEHDLRFIGNRDRKVFNLETKDPTLKPLVLLDSLNVREALERVLRLPSVSSKRYLTCKVDRSVTGLIVQQQCVGPLHTPIADVSVVALSHFDKVGAAVSVGEQPIKGLVNPEAGARMTIAECLTNLVFAPITDIKDVKMSGNWMWAAKCEGEGARLVRACTSLCTALKEIGCAIDGGKDSLSMAARVDDELVKAPGTIVLSAYVGCTDINKVVNPVVSGDKTLIHVRMGANPNLNRLGGSALAQSYEQIGDECPDVDDFTSFVEIFNMIQHLIKNGTIKSGHDVSDGGLITCLLEIAFSSNIQLTCSAKSETDALHFWFSEEAAVVIAVDNNDLNGTLEYLREGGASPYIIGFTEAKYGPDAHVKIEFNGSILVSEPLVLLREIWEETSDRLGAYQTSSLCLEQEKKNRMNTRLIKYSCNFDFNTHSHIWDESYFTTAPNVAIIREEGSNGDREMAAAFAYAGFQTFDVSMTDLLEGHSLTQYKGLAFVGGFSYADVLGSARGWAATIQYHEDVSREFKDFYLRKDTFSFGVCNGCQLMTQLGWIGEYQGEANVFLKDNTCGRFESFFGPVLIEKTASIMLKDMEGSVLGLWSSHGEGRFTFKSSEAYEELKPFVAIRYVNSDGQTTEEYPWNPNGSIEGTAAICSKDGRHLAMMPHSDRTFMSWQWPSYPYDEPGFQLTEEGATTSPWLKMFKNAFDWVKSEAGSH